MKVNFLQRIGLWFKRVWHRMVVAFRREQGSETFTFFAFVLLAFVFWFLQGLNDEKDYDFIVPVELQNLPENAVLIDELPESIKVRVRDKGPAMLSYYFKGMDPLQIDFQEYDKRTTVVLLPTQLRNLLQEKLSQSTQILSMSPDTLRIAYTQNPGKRVKVMVKSTVTTTPQTVLGEKITTDVDSVFVYGDYKYLNQVQEVYTEEIHEAQLGDTLRKTVGLVAIPHVRIIPDHVTVTIPVEEMISKTLEVPVVAQNLPANWQLTMLPATIQLTCTMPFSKFAEVNDSSFVLQVNQPDLSLHSARLGVKVTDAPDFVSHITLSQDSIDYILIELRDTDEE